MHNTTVSIYLYYILKSLKEVCPTNKRNTTLCPCDKIRYIEIDNNCLNQGTCLVIPVSIHCVCPNSHLLVIVEVFKEKKLYSRKIKEIFTGSNKEHNLNYCEADDLIDCLFVDKFKFYFINDFNPQCIHVEVSTQYIYNC